MPPIETFLSFCGVALVVELTPGPNMAYLAVLSASRGTRAGLAAVLGIALGLSLVGLVAAFGVAQAITASPRIYDGLRIAGVAYMLWLAYETWRDEDQTDTSAGRDGGYFLRGFAANVLNPKAAVFFVSLLPRFVDPARPVLSQTATLSLVYVAIATAIHLAIVFGAGRAAPFLQSQDRIRFARRGAACLLVLVAVWFAVTTART